MIDRHHIIAAIEAALAFGETSVIVRSAGAIAEVHSLLTLRRGAEWVTLGEEGGTHVHLKIQGGCRLRYTQPDEGNAALELLGPDGDVHCRVSFRGTNPARAESYNRERAANLCVRFGRLAECAGR
ncbi:MAG: hypothetical protein A4C66_03060 [Nitrospira sp. HN-bin3]|uniref:hypothetical protein n=1 Tax=Nitrospira cf. moscoviensis SBR1015 TaxID=96242 RepID=UPI000A0CC5A2|nr:hypothetical protein [Nitrospira cf. moscoviensis SBR1015]OQW37710.1 MAG: hypothetical protein A4C66_03060 [Nitrospira sp. HN-bin3]